jgi:Iron-dependent Transcriptional regulator
MLSSKLAAGIHILTLLALTPIEAVTSEYIAGRVNTDPIVIRRLPDVVRDAGIVESQGGVVRESAPNPCSEAAAPESRFAGRRRPPLPR